MGASKQNVYTEHQIQMANFFKVLAHPARLAIIDILSSDDTASFSNLYQRLDLAPATINQHLKVMFSGGFFEIHKKDNFIEVKISINYFKKQIDYLTLKMKEVRCLNLNEKSMYIKTTFSDFSFLYKENRNSS
jgi:DNA-binding transcriptional ArsR family regulator